MSAERASADVQAEQEPLTAEGAEPRIILGNGRGTAIGEDGGGGSDRGPHVKS
jgi:hypothetical protein